MNITIKEKISIIFKFVIIPFMIYFSLSVVAVLINNAFKTSINILIPQNIANIIFIAIMFPIYVKLRNKYQLIANKIDLRNIIYMIPLALGLSISLNIIIGLVFRDIASNEVSKALNDVTENISIIISILMVGIITPIAEEILFRGFMHDGIKILTNKYIAIIIVSLLFAIIHGNIEQGLYAFVAGLFFGYILEKYQNIIYTIVLHCVMNTAIAIFQNDLINMADIKKRLFLLIIMVSLFILTMIKINIKKEEV